MLHVSRPIWEAIGLGNCRECHLDTSHNAANLAECGHVRFALAPHGQHHLVFPLVSLVLVLSLVYFVLGMVTHGASAVSDPATHYLKHCARKLEHLGDLLDRPP